MICCEVDVILSHHFYSPITDILYIFSVLSINESTEYPSTETQSIYINMYLCVDWE